MDKTALRNVTDDELRLGRDNAEIALAVSKLNHKQRTELKKELEFINVLIKKRPMMVAEDAFNA